MAKKRNTTSFIAKYGSQLTEDVAAARATEPATGSPAVGRMRMKNAARLRLDVIDIDPQHREEFDEAGIARLAESLQAHGQLQPIRVRYSTDRNRYVLIAGERRLRAMKLAGWEEVDCTIAEGILSEAEILTQQILENIQREDLKPVERAKAFRDLMDRQSWDQKQLAAELKVSEGTISNSLQLLQLPSDIQRQVDAGQMKATIAIKTARKSRKPGPAKTSRKPKAIVIRTTAGKVTIEPKAGKTYRDVLTEALAASQKSEAKAA